jgi:hypothetical protein
MIWMIDNQMGRRNLTTAAKIRLAMKKHAFLSERAKSKSLSNLKQFQGTENEQSTDVENLPPREDQGKVRDLIGKDAGVSKTMETTQPFMALQFRNNSHNNLRA